MAIIFNQDTNDISASSGSVTIDGAAPGGGGGDTINVETLAGTKSLSNTDASIQALDPDAASRQVNLPAEEADLKFTIINTGTASTDQITVRDDSGTVTQFALGPQQTATVFSDGTSWYWTAAPQSSGDRTKTALGSGADCLGNNSTALGLDTVATGNGSVAIGNSSTTGNQFAVSIGNQADASTIYTVAIGYQATAGNPEAVAIGDQATANNASGAIAIGDTAQATGSIEGSVGIGRQTISSGQGSVTLGNLTEATAFSAIAIGNSTDATASGAISMGNLTVVSGLYSVGIGFQADVTADGAIALGKFSQATRTGELIITAGNTPDEYNRGSFGLARDTTNTTPTELWAGDATNARITIKEESVFAFDALITGRDNTTGNCCVYRFSGAIKRDGLNNTSLVGTPSKEVLGEDDAGFDCSVSADDTNEALVFTVTAAAANTTKWAGKVDFSETQF